MLPGSLSIHSLVGSCAPAWPVLANRTFGLCVSQDSWFQVLVILGLPSKAIDTDKKGFRLASGVPGARFRPFVSHDLGLARIRILVSLRVPGNLKGFIYLITE